MENKIYLITGANSGIGKETARAIAKMGATVVMACRNLQKAQAVCDDINAETGLNNVSVIEVDVSSQESIRNMALAFGKKFNKLDVLINNAGFIAEKKELTEDGFESMFGINHLGYFLTTHYLLPYLRKAPKARIVNVASVAHRFAQLDWKNLNAEKSFNSMRNYGLSKLCNILFTKELALHLKNTNITVNALHPGGVNSNFGKNNDNLFGKLVTYFGSLVLISSADGAKTSIYLATSPEVDGVTGKYYAKYKPTSLSAAASNPENAKKLWEISLQLTGVEQYGNP
jgi:NAD(P)-dependent dehydrogenase (short-subunit alcohol dehydrogenase family)